MSSLSSIARNSFKASLHAHSSATKLKSRFIWRFPSAKFDHLPSCTFKRLSSFGIQPITCDDELLQRQQLSILIYELGSHLNVSFTCIYTGVVYMHRFFMLHPFQQCLKESVAAACLFLACKVNEMARPLNEFTRHLYQISHSNEDLSSSNIPNITSEILSNHNQQIIDYENMLLSTLGFSLHVEQPYLIITRTSQTLSIPMEITQKAYEIATKSIFLTLFSMKYTTNLIACFALYLALKSQQINIPDNEDGTQWFHLLNEEFTEKLLKELIEEFQTISMKKSSQKYQERFEQLRQNKKIPSQSIKPKSNSEQTNCVDIDQYHYPIASTSGSVRSTTSSSSSSIPAQYQSNYYEQGSADIDHHTPNRSSSMTIPHVDYSPLTGSFVHPSSPIPPTTTTAVLQSSSSPKQMSNNFNSQYHLNNSSAKPIPTLMTSSTCNTYHNSHGSRYHTRYSLPTFRYASMSPTQRFLRPPPPPPPPPPQVLPLSFHPQPYHPAYSSYYPQQQTPLFYHPHQDSLNLNNKRLGEPPAPPTKRFRYNINTQQHY